MEGRSPEFTESTPEKTDSGFSEKRASRILEGKQTDNSQVKKRKPLIKKDSLKRLARTAKTLSLKTKILAAYERNSHAISQLLLMLSAPSSAAENDVVTEIRARQKIQEELLNALVLEQQGELKEDTLSKQLADLIK